MVKYMMGQIMGAYLYIVERLREPSTHSAIAAICGLLHVQMDWGLVQNIIDMTGIIFGTMGFFVAEAKPLTEVPQRDLYLPWEIEEDHDKEV